MFSGMTQRLLLVLFHNNNTYLLRLSSSRSGQNLGDELSPSGTIVGSISRITPVNTQCVQIFFQCVLLCSPWSLIDSVCLNVRLTVRLSQSGIMPKRLKLYTLMRSSLEDSPMTLVS